MRGVQDHVSAIPQEALSVRSLDAIDQANKNEVVFVEKIAELIQAWRGMIDRDLMNRIALRRGHIHSDKKTHFTLRF